MRPVWADGHARLRAFLELLDSNLDRPSVPLTREELESFRPEVEVRRGIRTGVPMGTLPTPGTPSESRVPDGT